MWSHLLAFPRSSRAELVLIDSSGIWSSVQFVTQKTLSFLDLLVLQGYQHHVTRS